MNILKVMISALLLSVGAMLPVFAEPTDLVRWGYESGWDIMIDPTLDNGCLIRKVYGDGSEVRIGVDRRDRKDKGYVIVINRKWGSIKDDETFPVTFDLDGKRYNSTAKGLHVGGIPGAGIYFRDRNFIYDIAKKYTMTIYNRNGGQIMRFSLKGTYNSLQRARRCERQQRG